MNRSPNVIAAFSEEQTARLTGVTISQLRYWDKTEFYRPNYPEQNRHVAFSRVYSFNDIVALRVLHVLRNQYGVSLHPLRGVSDHLAQLEESRWTGTRFWVLNKRVVWQEPDSERPQEVLSQQYVMPTIELEDVVTTTIRDVAAPVDPRPASDIGKVECSRNIAHNQPVIAGTRIPVEAIKLFAAAGYSTDQILQEYPDLMADDVRAAMHYGEQDVAA